jgi:hypothetical protein
MKFRAVLMTGITSICMCGSTLSRELAEHEWSLGSGIGIYSEKVQYRTRFSPWQAGARTAIQQVRFSGEEFPVVSLGYTRWFSRNWGLALSGRYSRTEWQGDNQAIPIRFTYEAWQSMPPFPVREVERQAVSPERATGSWSSYQAAVGLRGRIHWGPVEWSVEGLVVHDRTEGMTLENLYFENTIMISRGSLMTSSLLMNLESQKDSFARTGASLGIRASFPLGSRLAIYANGNFVWLPSCEVAMTLASIDPLDTFYNADTPGKVIELAEFDRFNTPEGKWSIEAGLLLRF